MTRAFDNFHYLQTLEKTIPYKFNFKKIQHQSDLGFIRGVLIAVFQ